MLSICLYSSEALQKSMVQFCITSYMYLINMGLQLILACQRNLLLILDRKNVSILKFQKKWNIKLDVKSELFQNMHGAQGKQIVNFLLINL